MDTTLFFIQGLTLILACVYGEGVMTNSWAVQIQSGGGKAADMIASKHGFRNLGQIGNLDDFYHFVKMHSGRMGASIMSTNSSITERLRAEKLVSYAEQQEEKMRQRRGYDIPNDPRWPDQWYLDNTGQISTFLAGQDIKAEKAWLQGLTGCGVTVGVIDDGVDYNHEDLLWAYVKTIQYDFLDNDNNPFPKVYVGSRESHGTKCAGVIGMEKYKKCGVGVAYNAFVTGMRLISSLKGATSIDEAEAFSWENSVIDIYSNSWGPSDVGTVIEGPQPAAFQAIKNGATNGRSGKGSIYVFAAGNGGQQLDSCAGDGYVSSIYTISVGSVQVDGQQSLYDEVCSGKMVVAFTNSPYIGTTDVITTSVGDSCVDNFIGTSASAPLVSGVIALLLEANPDLTWRDVQYLIAYTSNRDDLVGGEWATNAAGLRVSHKFGFGGIDAEAIVTRGKHWINVPAQLHEEVIPSDNSRNIASESQSTIDFEVESDIAALEHVQVIFSMDYGGSGKSERGQIEVVLISPSGTSSTLLPLRPTDRSSFLYRSWPLMSLHFWGENPTGEWQVVIKNYNDASSAEVNVEVSVEFYGTSEVPQAVSRIPEHCSSECDRTRGCAAPGAGFCDACAQLRIASSLKCTSSCPSGLKKRNGYCYESGDESFCDALIPDPALLNSNSALAKMAAMKK